MSKKTSKPKLIVFAVSTYVLAMVAFIFLWYFLITNISAVTRAMIGVTSIGRPPGGFQENVKIGDELSVVVFRYGWIPVFIGGLGDLTPYYFGYGMIVAAALVGWIKKRW